MKSILVPCAVFLTMAMSPYNEHPLRRPDVDGVLQHARECHWTAQDSTSHASCYVDSTRALDGLLDRVLDEHLVGVGPAEAAAIRDEHRAWQGSMTQIAPLSRDPQAYAEGKAQKKLQRRYHETKRHFEWIVQRVANVPKTSAAIDAPPMRPPASPVVLPTLPLSPAPPPKIRKILDETPFTTPVGQEILDKAVAGDAIKLAELARITYDACSLGAVATPDPRVAKSLCGQRLKDTLDGLMRFVFDERLAKLPEGRRADLTKDQRQWDAKMRQTCAIASIYPPTEEERKSALCWYKTTRERLGWASALK